MRGSCVTNASPLGLRSCMEDEGQALRSRLSGAGFKPPQAASVKSRCRERWGKRYRSGVDHGDERERTTDDVSKHFLATSKPGALLGQGWGVPDDGPTGVRHGGGVIRASMRNVRTCRSDVKGAGQAGSPCKSTKAEHRGGVARSSEEGSVMELERRGVQWDGDGQPVIGRNCRDLTTGSCPGREEPDETRGSRPVVCPGKVGMFSRRQTCRGKSQSPVVWIAEVMETETLKPIDEISLGEVPSHRAVTKVNALWPRK